MKINWNFLGGGEVQNKKPSVGGVLGIEYFLKLHNVVFIPHGLVLVNDIVSC